MSMPGKTPKLFTIGPVQLDQKILDIGAQQPPYFRDQAFAEIVKEVENGILGTVGAPIGAKMALMSGSGTAGMEAAVINLFDLQSRILIVTGGTFGRRFVDICLRHGIPHEVLTVPPGKSLRPEDLEPFQGRGFDGLLACAHETSTGQCFDLENLGQFCSEEGMLLVADAISSVLADPLNMEEMGVAAVILSSNKGLALPPGLAFVVLAPAAFRALKRPQSLYLDLKPYLDDAERGQTPFTSGISEIIMLRARLQQIQTLGGASAVIAQTADLAADFRRLAVAAGMRMFPEMPSNAMTALLVPPGAPAHLYTRLRDKYGWYINPPSGGVDVPIVRIGHLGALSKADGVALVEAIGAELQAFPES